MLRAVEVCSLKARRGDFLRRWWGWLTQLLEVASFVARNGERGGGRWLLVLVVAGVGFCGRLKPVVAVFGGCGGGGCLAGGEA